MCRTGQPQPCITAPDVEVIRAVFPLLHERDALEVAGLTDGALAALLGVSGMRIYGPLRRDRRAGIVAFKLDDIHPHDLAQVLAAQGVPVRAGHHCCQPVMRHLRVPATVRASFALYNRPDEIDVLVSGLDAAQRLLG